MKNKGKSLYFTIMGLVLAVTMMITSSITLAFFGASGGGTTTIKMGNAVTVDNVTEIKSKQIYVSPSELVDIDATATVKSPGDENSTTDAILRAKVVSNSIKSANVAVVSRTTIGSNTAYWVKGFDGYYYLVTSEGGDVCYTIETTTTGVEVPMQVSVMIPKTLSNADGGSTYSVTVLFCAIQARIYNDTGSALITNTIKNTKSIFDQVEGTALVGKSLERIEGNSIQYSTPTPSNPSEVVSVGDRTKNLININAEQHYEYFQQSSVVDFDTSKAYVGYASSGYMNESLKSFTVSGTKVSFTNEREWYGIGFPVEVSENTIYSFSWKTDSTNIQARVTYYIRGVYQTYTSYNYLTRSAQFTTPAGCDIVVVSLVPSVANTEVSAYDIMLEESSTATTYEPYGYKIPVNVDGDTYNIYLDEPLRKVGNVADYIDFTTGQLVRQVKKAQIDENSSFGKFSGVTNYSAFYMAVDDMLTHSQHGSTNLVVMSNKFTYHTVSGGNVNGYWTAPYQVGGSLATTYKRICFSLPNTITDVASAKLWFADNPVEYYYPVATPTTTDIDISHIPANSDAVYGVSTEVNATIVVSQY